MSTKITAPVKTEGRHETYFGDRLVIFTDGEAEVDFEINDGLKAYLRNTGYGIGSTKAKAPEDDVVIADPRELDGPEQVGTALRDAAVDPRDSDFLAPTNAGLDNPHGGKVVAPGIHGVGPGPIVPGTVGSPDYQEDKETATAEAVLVDGESVPKVTAALNGIARAEYALTKNEGKAKGLAQELDGDPADSDYTAEERELLGLDDIEDASDGDPAPDPDGDVPDPIGDPADEDPDADPGTPADENEDPDEVVEDAETLKGQALTDALKEAGLPVTGSADEKRQRLAEHQAQG